MDYAIGDTLRYSVADLPVSLYARGVTPHTSLHRLRALELDSRYNVEYITATTNRGRTIAALPIYLPMVHKWANQSMKEWVGGSTQSAKDFAFIGGREDYHSNGLIAVDARGPAEAPSIRDGLLSAAIQRCQTLGRLAVIPFVNPNTFDESSTIASAATSIVSIGSRYVIPNVGKDLEQYLTLLSRSRRSMVRRDLRLLEQQNVQLTTTTWSNVLDWCCDGIASVYKSHGIASHPLLIERRLKSYSADPISQQIAFVATSQSGHRAVTLGWIYEDTLELYEISMPVALGSDRNYLYLACIFYGPLLFMWEHKLMSLDLALDAGKPKTLRGAQCIDVSVITLGS